MLNCIDINDFETIEKIGSGSFGHVSKVRQKSTNNIFAAKTFLDKIDINVRPISDDLLRLIREVNIMSKLNHPSIVKIYGFSPINKHGKPKPVIILEYVPNKTLEYYIKKEKESEPIQGWDATQKLFTLFIMASVMKFLHSNNIVHRDLKPSNILMDYYNMPKMTDFGLSIIQHTNQQSLTMESGKYPKGTCAYMAPEIFVKEEYSAKSDIYAFGLIMYEMFSLEQPFSNVNIFKLGSNVINGDRPQFNKYVPEAYKNLIERCWDGDPNKRPSSEEIVHELLNNRDFITDEVDEEKFWLMVTNSNAYKSTFEADKRIIDIDLNVNKPNEDIPMIKPPINPVFKLFNIHNIFNFELKSISKLLNKIHKTGSSKTINPDKFYGLLDENSQNLVKDAFDDPEKQFIVGKNLIEGINNFPHNIEIGVNYLEESISRNYIDSAIYLVNKIIHDKGKLFTNDLNWAKKILSKFLKDENSEVYYQYGKIMKKLNNYHEALKYFDKGAANKHANSLYEYAKLTFSGIGNIQPNITKSIDYFKLAAQKGNIKSQSFVKFYTLQCWMKGFTDFPPKIQQLIISNMIKHINKQTLSNSVKKLELIVQPKHLEIFNLINQSNINDFILFCNQFSIIKINIDYQKQNIRVLNKIKCIKKKMNEFEVNLDISGIKKLVHLNGIPNLYDTITIDDSVKEISKAVFSSLNNLTNITFPKSIVEIAESLLSGCSSIQKIEIPDSVKVIKDRAFENCYSLMQIIIPNSVESIGISTFENCISLKQIRIPNSVKLINRLAFKNCSKLEQIEIPSSVTYIGESVFENCVSLKQITLLSPIKMLEFSIFKKCYSLEKIDLTQTISSIGISAFESCYSLKALSLPESVTSIKYHAFKNCLRLNQFSIPSFVASIDDEAFENCQKLKRIIIPPTVEFMGDFVFKNCTNLTDLIINSPSSSIRSKTLDGCPALKNVNGRGILEKLQQIGNNAYSLDKTKAFYYYQIAANSGDVDSKYKLGQMIEMNYGVPLSNHKASEYFKEAADGGHPNSILKYATMLENGVGITKNKHEAVLYYKKAADLEIPIGMYKYALFLLDKKNDPDAKKKACLYFKKAADKDYPDAMNKYGYMVGKGIGTDKNIEEACKYYKMSADKRNPKGLYNYALMLEKGLGINKNKDEALKYYKLSADKGNPGGMYKYAYILEKSKDVKNNMKEVFKYYEMSAVNGYNRGILQCARMLRYGIGTSVDIEKSKLYLQKLVDKKGTYSSQALKELRSMT